MAKRPTFFLSSTIYDFRDLRSAIKFGLEARGCRVLASECNDFGGDLAAHSYEACLSQIAQADYFVLLVGTRVGGWYDELNRVSITQQEYRTAYELHRKGQLKIVTFARSEVWQLREDRKALKRYLRAANIDAAQKVDIANHPSPFADDPAFISDFLTEIGRNRETSEATKTGAGKPTGNWIHVFKDFRDVDDVLSPLTFSGKTADEAAYSKALQYELLRVLASFLIKFEGQPNDYSRVLRKHIDDHPIEKGDRSIGYVHMTTKAWWSFSTILFHSLGSELNTLVINDALTSSLFLEYDRDASAYVQTPAYEALWKIVDEIRAYNRNVTAENLSILSEFSPRGIGRTQNTVQLPTDRLAMLYIIGQRWVNIVSLSIALIRHLEGQPFEAPELMPFSPIKGLDEEIAQEAVTAAEARAAMGL